MTDDDAYSGFSIHGSFLYLYLVRSLGMRLPDKQFFPSSETSQEDPFVLENNYPNPFNPQTRIQFSIPTSATVEIAIYDIHGRLVRNLVASEHHESGHYNVEWDAKDNSGQKVASGPYFCRMQAGLFFSTKRLTLLK